MRHASLSRKLHTATQAEDASLVESLEVLQGEKAGLAQEAASLREEVETMRRELATVTRDAAVSHQVPTNAVKPF